MSNTAIDNKNHQPNNLSLNKFSNNNSEASNHKNHSQSGSDSQKRQKITLIIKGDERRPDFRDEVLSSSSSKDEKDNSRLRSPKKDREFERESLDEKSSGIHLIYNSENRRKPTINVPQYFERIDENEKQNNPSDKSPSIENQVQERGIGNLNSPKDDEEKRFKSNNSIFSASIVTKDVNVKDGSGRYHQVPKNFMKVKIPKSPKTPTNNDSNYATRGAEINPEDDNNSPSRRRVKKKVPKNRQEKPQLSISQGNYNRTPTTMDGSERRKVKRKKNNNEYIPSDYHPQVSPSPNYNPYNFINFNNNEPYIELEIVPEEDSNIEERYPSKNTSNNKRRRQKRPRHIHVRHETRRKTRRPTSRSRRSPRGTYYSDEYDYDYDSYYDYRDESNNDQYSSEDRRPSKRKESANSSTQNIESASTQTDNNNNNNSLEQPFEQAPAPIIERLPTPTQNVGTETKLNRNSSSTQTSFLHTSRATKSVETSSLSRNQNIVLDNSEEDNENAEEDTNENVFNSPKSSNVRDRSAASPAYQNLPGVPSSPHTFNVPRSPHSPRSPPPTYKSDVEGLTNSARKSQRESQILTRNSNLDTNSNEPSVNHVPISTDDEEGNAQNNLSISSLEKKIKQIKPQPTKNKGAELEEESDSQKRQPPKSPQNQIQSPKFLSESNSGSAQGDSNLFNKKENSNHNNDESYEECVLKPSRGSSILSQQKSSNHQSHSRSQLSESQGDSNEQQILDTNEEEEEENTKKESSHMSTKSNHSKPASRHVSAENSSLKGKNSHVSSTFNLNEPSQSNHDNSIHNSIHNSITTESAKQPSLINEGSSKKGTGAGSSKVSFNSKMSHSSAKPSAASKSTISIESEVQEFITPDKKSTSSKKPTSKQSSLISQNSLLSEKSHHSKIASSINSPHNSNLGSSIHSPHNSKVGSSIHSIHNSNGTNSIVSEASLHQNPSLVSNNSASTFIGDKYQNQFSEAFDHLSEFTTSDPSERFIKKRGFEIDSVIDSEISHNSAISIGSNASDRNSQNGSVLVEEIEEDEIEEEFEDSQAAKGESSFSNIFDGVSRNIDDQSSDFNLFSSQTDNSSMRSRRVNKRFIDPSEQYMKLGLQVLEVKTRDPRVTTELDAEIPPLSNSIHEVQIEPAVPNESKPLFVQIGYKDQDTILSTPTRKCVKLDDPPSNDEAFSTSWESNFLVTGFENSAILFTLCRTEFSGFKKLASASIPLNIFNDINDGWFDLIPENDDDEMSRSGMTPPNSPSMRSSIYGKIHIVTNIESKISLPPFDIEKQVEIIASKDQINLDNRNQEEIERIKAISIDFSSTGSHSSSIHDGDDYNVQKKKLSKKFNNFREQFSSVSDVSGAYMNSENADSDGHRIRQRKISAHSSKNSLQVDDNRLNSSSSLSRRRRKENHSETKEKEASLNDLDSNSFNSASSTSRRRRIKVPKNQANANDNNEKHESGLDDFHLSSSSHGSSKVKKNDSKKLSSASGGNDFAFEMISSSSTKKKQQNQPNQQNQNQSQVQNQSQNKGSDIDNYFKDISSTMPETITFDNSSTVVGSNFTLSGFPSPLKGNQNTNLAPSPVSTNNKIEEEEEESDGIHALSVFSSANSDAPTNSIDLAEVKKEKTLSRDPPKRTHVNASNVKASDDDSLNFDDSC